VPKKRAQAMRRQQERDMLQSKRERERERHQQEKAKAIRSKAKEGAATCCKSKTTAPELESVLQKKRATLY